MPVPFKQVYSNGGYVSPAECDARCAVTTKEELTRLTTSPEFKKWQANKGEVWRPGAGSLASGWLLVLSLVLAGTLLGYGRGMGAPKKGESILAAQSDNATTHADQLAQELVKLAHENTVLTEQLQNASQTEPEIECPTVSDRSEEVAVLKSKLENAEANHRVAVWDLEQENKKMAQKIEQKNREAVVEAQEEWPSVTVEMVLAISGILAAILGSAVSMALFFKKAKEQAVLQLSEANAAKEDILSQVQLNKKYKNAADRVSALEASNKDLQKKAEKLPVIEKQNVDLKMQIGHLQNAQEENGELEDELDALRNTVPQQKRALQSEINQLKQLEKKNGELEEQVGQLDAVRVAHVRLKEGQAEVQTLSTANQRLQREVDKLPVVRELNAKLKQEKQVLVNLQQENEEMEALVNTLPELKVKHEELCQQAVETRALEKENSELKEVAGKLSDMETENKALKATQAEVEKMEQENVSIKEACAAVRAENEKLKKGVEGLDALQAEYKTLSKNVQELVQLQSQIDSLKEKQQELEALKISKSDILENIKRYEGEISDLTAVAGTLPVVLKKKEDLEKQVEAVRKLQEDQEEAARKLERERLSLTEQHEKMDAMGKKNEGEKLRLEEKIVEYEKLKEDLKELKGRLGSFEKDDVDIGQKEVPSTTARGLPPHSVNTLPHKANAAGLTEDLYKELESRNSELKAELAELHGIARNSKHLSDQITELKAKREELRKQAEEIMKLEAQISVFMDKVDQKDELQRKHAELKMVCDKLDKMSKENEGLDERRQELAEAEIKRLELNAHENLLVQLKSENAELEASFDSSELEKLRHDNSDLKEQLSVVGKYETENSGLKKEIEKLAGEPARNEELKRHVVELRELLTENRKLEQKTSGRLVALAKNIALRHRMGDARSGSEMLSSKLKGNEPDDSLNAVSDVVDEGGKNDSIQKEGMSGVNKLNENASYGLTAKPGGLDQEVLGNPDEIVASHNIDVGSSVTGTTTPTPTALSLTPTKSNQSEVDDEVETPRIESTALSTRHDAMLETSGTIEISSEIGIDSGGIGSKDASPTHDVADEMLYYKIGGKNTEGGDLNAVGQTGKHREGKQ